MHGKNALRSLIGLENPVNSIKEIRLIPLKALILF
jgi:hypothetical protein